MSAPAVEQMELARRLRAEQNFPFALVVGLMTAVVTGLLWVVLTLAYGGRTGGLIVLLGVVVGLAVQLTGRGLTWQYRALGAVMALVGVGTAHALMAGLMGSMVMGIGPLRALAPGNIGDSFWLYGGVVRRMDFVLGALAVLLAAYFSQRRLSPNQRRALFVEQARG